MNKEIRRIMIATFLLWFSMYTYPSFLQAYAEDVLMATPLMIGLITGSYGFTQMLIRIPLGILSDLSGRRKPFIVAGMAASALAAAGFFWTKSAMGALFFRALTGVAASTWVNVTVLYSAHFEKDEVNEAMSKLSLPQYISQVAAMLVGSMLAQLYGAKWAFALSFFAAGLGIAVTLGIEDFKPREESEAITARTLLQVVRDRDLLLSTALSTLFHFVCWGTVLGFVANWATNAAGFTTAQLGFLSIAYMLPNAVVSRFSGASLALRFGEKKVQTAGFLLVAAACFLYPLARSAATLFPVQMLFGVGMGLILPLTMSGAIRSIPPAARGAAMGFYQSVYGLGMFAGPVIAGAVVQSAGYEANFVLMGALALCGGAMAWIFLEKGK
ncbi:MAG: MFS transporter [Christensenellales bacterium]|jgi:MFS family permease